MCLYLLQYDYNDKGTNSTVVFNVSSKCTVSFRSIGIHMKKQKQMDKIKWVVFWDYVYGDSL